MKKILYSLIAILALCYAPKTNAQSYNMSNLGTISGACGGNFYDSGGPAGTYANGENYTATFCAPAGQYITFTFSAFNVENSFEHLIIYNGPTVGSPMIGDYTGTNSPGTVTSTLGGCLTFTFTSDGSITNPGWAAAISCSTTPPPPPPPTPGSCGTAQPFCTATGTTYPASTGTTAPAGPNYGCLFTQPNPAWYYLNVATSGAIDINLSNSAGVDIDFICWGPFASQAAMCTAIFGGAVGIDCSYSTAATEQVNIPAAVAGEWYMLLVTNFANVPTNITAAAGNAPGVDGTTNCAILCNMTGLTAVPGACAPATGQYSVTGQVTLSYPPTTGNLTITSSCGGSVVLLPPWTSPISYTLPGITATGGACNITATFSSDPTCTMTVPYTSPAPCNTCSITAGNSGPICAGGTYGLTASNVAGATYAWTSSSGYSSSTQNPTGIAAPAAGTYTYTVTATVGATTCTAVTTLTVNPQPTVVAEPAQTYCAGAAVPANTFASTPAGATFTWTNSNTAIGLAASGTTSVPAFTATNATGAAITATITITPTLGTCVGPTSTYIITVNPIPVSTFTQSPNQCLATNSFNFTNTGSSGAGYTYSWNFGGGGAAPATSTTNNQTGVVYTTPGTYTVTHTITSPAGCTSTTTSTVTIYPQPVVTVNDPTICAGATTTLTAGGASTYVWSAGATTTGVTTASVTPGPTSYTVTGTDGNGCTDTDVATVTVNPLPTVTAEPNLTFCAGDAVPANTFNSTPIGATFSWTNSNTAIGLAASGTTSTPGFTAVNGTAAPITATISITPTLAGCVGPAITYTITVNPLPTVVAEANQTYCPGAAVPANTFVSNPAGGTFTWTNSNTAIGLGASGTTSTPAFTAANATGGAITGTVTITPTLAGCVGTPSTYTITVNPTPPVAVTSVTICPGGTATLTASGASTYTWSAGATPTGVTTATASPATTTSYTVTGTSAAGCTATAVATVTVSSALAITVNSPTICAGATATLTAGGGTTYTWSAGATSTGVNTASATPAITTTYTVTGTTAGCSNTAVATVTVTPLPSVVSEPNLTFCAGAAVPANTFASTPAGATFTWTNSNTAIGLAASGTTSTPGFTATNATASPITATIAITPTSGTCVGPTSTYTITVNPLPITTVTSATICPGGIATLTAGGASTYVWSAGVTVTGVTTATAAPATTTSYTVTGTSAAGCTSTAVATVTVAAALTVTVNSPTICNGSVATLTAGGAATYAWSAGASSTGVNTASASPTSTTSYTVTGTSAGCTGTAVATVTVNAIPTVTVNSPTICAGATATLTAGGATTYTWSAGATSTGVNTATATPATTTSYTVTGTTAGCSNTAVATVTVNPIPVVTVNSPTICAGTTAALTATGAATYAWSAGAVSTGVATANATPATTTSYTVTGTLSGCTATAVATVTVTPLPVVTVNSVTICAGQTANLTAGGATTYTWSGGASSTGVNTATAAPATTTTYTVTGTTSGCTATAVSTVTVNPLPVVTVNSPTICAGATAALTAGGASTYVWSAGATSTGVNTADATPATTTSYTVTGTTAGCTGSAVTTVTVNPLPVVSVNSPTVCPGQTATLTAAGAATYTWSAGATSTGVNTATASPGATTSYTVTGTSAGCTGTAVATVTIGGSISVTVNSPTICPGGTATLTATGGATYVWSAGATPTGVSTATASPGATTSYTVTGTMGGCTGSAVATVTVSGAIAIVVNSPTICNGQTANLTATGATTYVWSAGASSTGVNTADATPATTTSYTVTGTTGACTGTGVATVTVTPLPTVTVTSPTICIGTSATLTAGGATTYTWSAGATSTGATTATASPVTTTTYTVTGTASGCTNTAISTVTVTPLPVVTVNSPTICAGQTATLTGLGATTYTWSAGATSTGVNTADASPLTTTSYTVTGTATGCSNTAVATVTVNPLPIVTVNSPTICNGQVASLTASGASTYTWSAGASSTGVNTADATPATTTSYTVTGTSAAGCTGTAIATVTVTPIPNVTVTSPTICIGATATMTAGGATTYVWSAGATPSGATTATASPATTTSYTVTGTASGCSSTAVATVTVNPLPIVTVNSPSICPGSTATLTANGATTYAWTAGAVPAGVNTATASPATTTSYTVTGTLLGCTSTAVATVSINSALTVDAGPNDTICFGQSTPLTVTPNGAGYTYSWSPAAGLSATNIFNPSANPTTTTTYVVVVTDINGCTGNDNVTIYSDPQINPVVSGTNITCNSACNGSTTVATTGGSNAYTYLWSNAATTATAGSLCPGTYSVTVTDSWGCTATGSTSITQPALLTSSVTASTPVLCNGACNGTATAAGAGGTGAFTYSWNTTPVQTTATASAMCAGTYTVTISDANNCTSTSTITINQPFALTAAITAQTNVNCFGTSTGSVTVAGSGGTPTYQYSINAGTTYFPSGTFTGLAAGSYTILVRDANNCTVAQAVTITAPAAITSSVSGVTAVTCFGGNDGALTVTGAGGTPTFQYSINGGTTYQSSGTFTGLTAGPYTVILQDGNGCTFTQPVTITQPTQVTVTATKVDATCGAANGSLTATGANGTPGYTYSIGGAFQVSGLFTGLAPATYTVTVKDANGCTGTTTISVVDLSGLTASITAQTNVSCNGGTNGSVTVTASGSTAPYLYSINGGALGGSGTFTGLAQGSYTVVAQDGNGCTVSVPVIITQPTVLTGNISAQTNITCNGLSNGSVTIAAAGGTTAYSYSLDGGAFVPGATFTGMSVGAHTITVQDANGCTVAVPITITQPTALAIVLTTVNATCTAANGSATATPAGATPAYSYLWSPGGATTPTNNAITAGNYTVTVTDANGCTLSGTTSVGQAPGGPAVISSSTNVTCAAAADGTATVSMGAGSTPPFSYAWSPSGQTTVTATNLGPASYTVTVTDGNGCISTASVVITQPTALSQTFTNTNVSCFGGTDGIITINPAGGTPGYSYLWTPGSYTTATITPIAAGTYTVTYTDANGCSATASTAITQPAGMTLSSTQVDATCNLANGSATVTVGGGTGPYTFLWSDAAAQTTATATGLPSNTYVCTVTDANGCTQTHSVTINNLAGPVATVFSSTNVSCFGLSDGAATVTVSGGTIPFTFAWNNGQTLPTATNLVAGTYTLVATDASGCIASTSVTITEPLLLDLAITGSNPSCFGSCDGSMTSNTFGGTAPYVYLWNPGGITTPTASSLCAGTYTLQVTDANGCTAFKPATLTAPPAVTATTTTTNISCSGLCNGTATANPMTGTGPYTYLWSDINAQTTQTATGLCAGTYTVTVTDAGGCTATVTATITTPASMIASITTIGNVTCAGACDGFATATVTGGSAPYAYLWNPTSTAGASVNNMCADNYTVTVTDANGCTASTTANITEPFPLVATITSTNVSCFGACDATANAVYTGGTGPYTFQWTPTFATTPNIASVCAGVHNLSVTDGNGCIATASVVITEPTILAVTTTTTNSSCGNADGSACAAITGGVPPFSYSWNDPSNQTTNCANNINAGVYTISITDGNGCSVTGLANVNDNTAPVVTIPTSANVTCAGAANGSAQSSAVGGIIPYTIAWTPTGQTTAFISGLSGGIYSVTYTDSIGCVGSATVTINEPAPLVSGILTTSNVSCFLTCDGTATVGAGGGTTPYTYLWNTTPVQTTATATGLCAAGYTVTITDANGCVSTSTTTITTPTAISLSVISTTNVSCNGGSNGAINIDASGGSPGYTYTWTPNIGSGPMVTGLVAGTYTVTVTDQNGCSSTITATVTEPTAIALSTISNPSTCGNNNGFVSVTPTGGTPGYTYLWTDPSSQTTAIATSLFAGTYTVTVTDSHGCTADTSVVLLDHAGPTLDPFTTTPPLCNGTALGTATVFPVGGQPLYSYLWSGIGAQTTQTASALVAGTYTVTVTDANGCTVVGSVTVVEPAPTNLFVSPPDTICVGQNAIIYGAGYGGTPTYTYTWIAPAAFTGAGPHVVNPTVTTTYDLFVTDANGCVSPTQTITLYVHPPLSVTATDATVCSGSFVTISAVAGGGNGGPYTYTWSNAVSGSSQSVSPPIGSSPYDYIVIADDGCSLLATDTATVTVNPLPVSFMLASDTAGCEDFTVTFNGVSDIGTSYSWNFGDGSAPVTGEPVTHTYPAIGGVLTQYDVTLTVTSALGCSATVQVLDYIDVYPGPTAEFSYSPTTITQTSPLVDFTDLSTGGPVAWQWFFDNPNTLYTDVVQNPSYFYQNPGQYEVMLVVTNSFGCVDTAWHNLEVVPEYTLYVPNAFTPFNHDGVNDTFFPQGVGIDKDNFTFMIFDRWGNMIYKTNDPTKGWDGHANGGDKIAQIDTYVWKIDTQDFQGNPKQYVGTVTIVK